MSQESMSEPIIVCLGCAILALAPEEGHVMWHIPTESPVIRMFRIGTRMLAIAGTKVICIDVTKGVSLSVVELGFAPDTGMVCNDVLVLARGSISPGTRPDAVVCLTTDGQVKWRGTLELESSGLLSGTHLFRTYSPQNEPTSEVRYKFRSGSAGVAFGSNVAQPDPHNA